MQINLDQDKINAAIDQTASKAVEDALKGFAIQQAIADVVSKEVATGAIAQAIRQAVQQMDTVKLTQHLSAELQRHTTRAVTHILQEGLLQAVCRLRGIGDYSENDRRERLKLKTELFSD